MAHELYAASIPALRRNIDLDTDAIRQTRIDLAASFRMCAELGRNEGIDNHFSAMLPGHDDLFLVSPYGYSFHEITASSLLICDFDEQVAAGEGKPEASAFYIHARLHLQKGRARAAFHTHMPNATALSMIEGPPLAWAGQTALKFYGRIAVDETYNSLALDATEGDRIATAAGDADIVFMRNHGVMVMGPTVAGAWDDLYYLERAAEVQVSAMSTGAKLLGVEPAVARSVVAEMRQADPGSARLHLDSVRRRLARTAPDFAD